MSQEESVNVSDRGYVRPHEAGFNNCGIEHGIDTSLGADMGVPSQWMRIQIVGF
jgi:hypothetical protein